MGGGDPAGGSFQVAQLIDEAGEALTADLKRYFGVRLADVVEGKIPVREVLAYIKHMPPDSATGAHLQGGDQYMGWDAHLYMLANLYDAIRENTYVTAAANSKRKPSPPDPFPRPKKSYKHAKKKDPKTSLFALMARQAFFNGRKKQE